MQLYFAPLQGATNREYRQIHARCFGGVDKYYTPFVSPTKTDHLTAKEREELLPVPGTKTVPQALCSDPKAFLAVVEFARAAGFSEVNLNLGCPSGTVTAKGKGAGMLRSLLTLEFFLDEIYSGTTLPISIKTRLGWESPAEFEPLLFLLCRYPVYELTIHARTRMQAYEGQPDRAAVLSCLDSIPFPAVYNGDLFSVSNVRSSGLETAPFSALMIGRGLLSNPALARTLKGGPALERNELWAFREALWEAARSRLSVSACLGRMRELDKYMACSFEEPKKPLKKLRKATSLERYQEAVEELFSHPLREDPGFLPDL